MQDQRYEPLPGFVELPGWIWRRTSRRLRIAVAVALLSLVASGVALVPTIREAQRERAATEDRAREQQHAQRIRALQAEQRPRFARSDLVASPDAGRRGRFAARAALIDELGAAIVADARRRVRAGALDGPVLRSTCEPFPPTVGAVPPHEDLARGAGRYACLAITSEVERTARNSAGAIGHPYRAQVDFRTGRYAYCKISGRPDPIPDPKVTTPRACGGT